MDIYTSGHVCLDNPVMKLKVKELPLHLQEALNILSDTWAEKKNSLNYSELIIVFFYCYTSYTGTGLQKNK